MIGDTPPNGVPNISELQALGAKLAEARHASGMSQEEVGYRLSVPAGNISRWERGKNHPGFIYVLQLCQLYGVAMEWIGGLVSTRRPRNWRDKEVGRMLRRLRERAESNMNGIAIMARSASADGEAAMETLSELIEDGTALLRNSEKWRR